MNTFDTKDMHVKYGKEWFRFYCTIDVFASLQPRRRHGGLA